jgi:hypothetical protein
MYYSDEDYDIYDSGDFYGSSSDNEFDDDLHDHCDIFMMINSMKRKQSFLKNGKIFHWRISRVLLMEIKCCRSRSELN